MISQNVTSKCTRKKTDLHRFPRNVGNSSHLAVSKIEIIEYFDILTISLYRRTFLDNDNDNNTSTDAKITFLNIL